MVQKQIGRCSVQFGRTDVSGVGSDGLGSASGDSIEVDVADAEKVAHALIDSEDTERVLLATLA